MRPVPVSRRDAAHHPAQCGLCEKGRPRLFWTAVNGRSWGWKGNQTGRRLTPHSRRQLLSRDRLLRKACYRCNTLCSSLGGMPVPPLARNRTLLFWLHVARAQPSMFHALDLLGRNKLPEKPTAEKTKPPATIRSIAPLFLYFSQNSIT